MPENAAGPVRQSAGQAAAGRNPARGKAGTGPPLFPEHRLVASVRRRWGSLIADACRFSSVPTEFLAGLVANESGGDPAAKRFEPAVYRRLKSVADGSCSTYAGLTSHDLDGAIARMLRPAAGPVPTPDEALRGLASSWGLTQIMGYHLVRRRGALGDLREPRFHLRLALQLLAEFAERYQLDPRREFAEMFRCWNTGRPDGQTADPAYVDKGLRRMEIYREIERTGDRASE